MDLNPFEDVPRVPLPLDTVAYRLRWPREIFLAELDEILGRPDHGEGVVGHRLIEEAFATSTPAAEFLRLLSSSDMLKELSERRDELKQVGEGRAPYYIERTRPNPTSSGRPDWEAAQRRVQRLSRDYDTAGYFHDAWGVDCVDDPRDPMKVPDAIQSAIGFGDIDPFFVVDSWGRTDSLTWAPEVVLSVVEILHDHISRPRSGHHHHFGDCGWHGAQPSYSTGQALFRHEVNRIFADTHIPYRLSDAGVEYGRVVEFTDDAREDLARALLQAPPSQEQDEVAHAISQFRAHGATPTAKRAAVTVLAGVLERHRGELSAEGLTADERELFRIANTFSIRHKDAKQRTDYDDAYLDWIFWWYLATIELLGKLAARTVEDDPNVPPF